MMPLPWMPSASSWVMLLEDRALTPQMVAQTAAHLARPPVADVCGRVCVRAAGWAGGTPPTAHLMLRPTCRGPAAASKLADFGTALGFALGATIDKPVRAMS